MRKKSGYIILAILIIGGLIGQVLHSLDDARQSSYSILVDKKGQARPVLLIKTNREAVLYAMSHGFLDKLEYNKIQENFDHPLKWKIHAAQNDKGEWILRVMLKNILPSYQCVMALTDMGDIVRDAECGWNK